LNSGPGILRKPFYLSHGPCLYKRKEREMWTQTDRQESHVKTEADTGVSEDEKCQESLEAEKGKEGFSL
jgi:hypothetical protein